MERRHLATLVDHAKPFKGSWQLYRDGDNRYVACHQPGSATHEAADSLTIVESCQDLGDERQACLFTSQLQFHGWSFDGHDDDCQAFRLACRL